MISENKFAGLSAITVFEILPLFEQLPVVRGKLIFSLLLGKGSMKDLLDLQL